MAEVLDAAQLEKERNQISFLEKKNMKYFFTLL